MNIKDKRMLRKINFAIVFLFCFAISVRAQVVDYITHYGTKTVFEGKQLYDAGLVKNAEMKLIETVKQFPDNPAGDRAVLLQAATDIESGNYKLAEANLTKFIQNRDNSPFRPYAALQRAFATIETGRYEQAEYYFVEAQKYAEEEFEARDDSRYNNIAHQSLYWRGIAMAEQGKYQDAQPVFQECVENYPDGEYADDAYYALGQNAEVNRRYKEAIDYFDQIEENYPYSNSIVSSLIRQANSRLIRRNPTDALVLLNKTEMINGHIREQDSIGALYEKQTYVSNPREEVLYLKGESYNLKGNYERAMIIFSAFLETYYDSPLTHYVRLAAGWAELNMGNNNAALNHYDEIIMNISDDENSRVKALAQLYRTVALVRKGNTEQARKELSSLSVQPTYPYLGLALLELGQLQYREKEYDEAQRTLERGDRESIDASVSVRINLLLGSVYLEQERWDKSVEEYSDAEQLAERSSYIVMPQKDWYLAEARLKRGIALVRSHRSADAIPVLRSFLSQKEDALRTDEALFWLAEAYFRTDLLKNAQDTYNKLLDKYPDTKRREEALYGLGWSYFRRKELSKSANTFDKLIHEFPDSEFALEVLARQADGYFLMKNYSKASETYRRAKNRAPKTDEGQYCAYQLFHALYYMKSYDQAITSSLDFVREYPRSPYAPKAMYLVGWIRFLQNKYHQAIDNFKFLIKAYSQSGLVARAHYAIGDSYYNMGDYEKAIEAYKTVWENYSSSDLAPEAMKSMQQSLLILGRDDEAMALAENVIETNPSSPFARDLAWGKTEIFYSGGNYENAIEEYKNFIKKYPNSEKNDEALYRIGKSYLNLDETEKAIEIFHELKKKHPDSKYTSIAFLELGLMYKNKGDIDKADSVFSQVRENYPEQSSAAQAGFEQATMKFTMGDTTAALNIFREAADTYPEMEYGVQSRWKVARYLRYKGLNDSARAEFRILAENKANRSLAAESQYRLGELYFRDEMYEKAVDEFKKYKEKFSKFEQWYPLALMNLGECYEKLEKFEKARETYMALKTLHPDDDYGKTASLRLKRLPD